jgi:hypothetical protein
VAFVRAVEPRYGAGSNMSKSGAEISGMALACDGFRREPAGDVGDDIAHRVPAIDQP